MALSDIMNAFSRGSTPTPAPATPGQIPAGASNNTVTNSGTAPNGSVPATAAVETSPLDQFKDLWQNDANKEAPKDTSIYGGVKPEEFIASASKVDFTKAIKPETLTAIQAGGEGAVKALAEALNSASQAVYANSSLAATKLIDNALKQNEGNIDKLVSDKLKQMNFSNSLRETNPVLNHEAAKPLVSMIEAQFTAKYPNATQAELTKMAQDYFVTTFQALSTKPESNTSTQGQASETNWLKEFGG